MNRQCPDPAPVDAEIERVRSLGVDALRSRWQSMFGCRPPPGFTKDLLARMIAHRIQEEAFGGLGRETLRVLERLARGETPGQLGRRLKPGTVLVREYQGIRHSVTIVPDGFLWQDQIYPSLSNIARAITGTSWNGPRFFGLRMSPGAGRNGHVAGEQEPLGSSDASVEPVATRPHTTRGRGPSAEEAGSACHTARALSASGSPGESAVAPEGWLKSGRRGARDRNDVTNHEPPASGGRARCRTGPVRSEHNEDVALPVVSTAHSDRLAKRDSSHG